MPPVKRYRSEEVSFLREIYSANREENWRVVADRFRGRFGCLLSQGQLRYVRKHYLFPNGQADNPRYRNRKRGKRNAVKG